MHHRLGLVPKLVPHDRRLREDGAEFQHLILDKKGHDLGKADFFFTSHMTNCTFKVLTSNMKTPKVAHIAGTMGSSDKVKKEKRKLLRRLQRSISENRKLHKMCNQTAAYYY